MNKTSLLLSDENFQGVKCKVEIWYDGNNEILVLRATAVLFHWTADDKLISTISKWIFIVM